MTYRLVARLVPAALVLAGLSFATPAAAATTPAWEPDANSHGSLSFYDTTGKQVTGGNDLSHLFDYAAAATATDRATTKATLYFAFPNSKQPDTSEWFSSARSTAATFPKSSNPAPLNSFGQRPVAFANAAEANLKALLGSVETDGTAGYANTVQVRVYDTGPGVGAETSFWSTDISYDATAGTWSQLYPAVVSSATSVSLAASPAGAGVTGSAVTFTATVSPADAAGSVQFADGGTALGSPVAVSGGTAQYTTSALGKGSHSITAQFVPTSGDLAGSVSDAQSYVVADLPGAPSAVAATAGNQSATVTWTAPASDGGSAITSYQVQSSTDGATWTAAASTSGSARSATVSRLVNGTGYRFRVLAGTAVGTGAASDPSPAVTPVADGAVVTISGLPGSAKYGTAAMVTATLSNARTKTTLGNQPLTLFRRSLPGSSFAAVAKSTTSSKGAVSARVTLTGNAQFQWRYAGSAAVKAATSAVRSVTVSRVVAAAVTPTSVKHGAKAVVRVYGTVTAGAKGQRVTVQQLNGRSWRTVGTPALATQKLPNGRTTLGYVFARTLSRVGSYSFRVLAAATSTLAAGTSATVTARAR